MKVRLAVLMVGLLSASCNSNFSNLPEEDRDRWSRCVTTLQRTQCGTTDPIASLGCVSPMMDRYSTFDDSESRQQYLLQQGCPESMVRTTITPTRASTSGGSAGSTRGPDESSFAAFDEAALTNGRDFHCSGNNNSGQCFGTLELCEQYRQNRTDTGRDPGSPCSPHPNATCFSAINVRTNATESLCFYQRWPLTPCANARAGIAENNRRNGVEFRRLSQCVELRSSRLSEADGGVGTPTPSTPQKRRR